MVNQPGAEAYVPQRSDLKSLRSAATCCEGCGLYRDATQVVFGDGPQRASMLMVGEQPGDQEDRKGEPFVGPAGGLLDRLLEDAGIERSGVYMTNAVKHFKFTRPERGKQRLHKKPARSEVVACRPWLVAEINAVQAPVVVCLGATAAQSLLGSSFKVSQRRGEPLPLDGDEFDHPATVLATTHPSAILRARDEDRREAYAALRDDLAEAARHRAP